MTNQTKEVADVAEQLSSSDAVCELGIGADHPLRIAVASSDGERVDRHFGQTDDLWVFDVTAAEQNLVEVRNIDANAIGDEDRRQTIYRLLGDCKVMQIAKIGVGPQARLASFGVESIDKYANASVELALRDVHNTTTNSAATEAFHPTQQL